MGVFKYVMCWIVVMILAVVPVFPPVSIAIASFFGVHILFDSYYITVTFNPSMIPPLLMISIMLSGSFIAYCIYHDKECTWRTERVKQDTFIPDIFDTTGKRSI